MPVRIADNEAKASTQVLKTLRTIFLELELTEIDFDLENAAMEVQQSHSSGPDRQGDH